MFSILYIIDFQISNFDVRNTCVSCPNWGEGNSGNAQKKAFFSGLVPLATTATTGGSVLFQAGVLFSMANGALV